MEIDWCVSKYGINYIMFVNELFVKDIGFVTAITERIKKYNIRYWVQTRVDMITKEILQMLKDSGCYEITYGVESADNNILKSMRKHITVEQIERAFELSREVEIPAKGYIIFGDLEETAQTISNSLKWWQEHPDYDIRLWWILTFPGSYLYKVACDRGLITDRVQFLKDNSMQINVSKMPDEQYWGMVKKMEFFQIVTQDGINVDFDGMDEAIDIIGKKLNVLHRDQKVAIWPATLDVVEMLNYLSPGFIKSENVYFVNVNPYDSFVQGIERFGKRIYTPSEMFDHTGVETVLYAFGHRSSKWVYNQICSMVETQFPQIKRMIKLSELADPKFTL